MASKLVLATCMLQTKVSYVMSDMDLLTGYLAETWSTLSSIIWLGYLSYRKAIKIELTYHLVRSVAQKKKSEILAKNSKMHRQVWNNYSSFTPIGSIHLSQSIWAECKTKHQKWALYQRMYLNCAWVLLSLTTCFTQAVLWEIMEKNRKLLNASEGSSRCLF